MTYVMSDIHGYYRQYKKLLKKINFSEADTLYMLGDVVDRGPESMRILLDMHSRTNIIPIMGNHDELALRAFISLQKYPGKSYNKKCDPSDSKLLLYWFHTYDGEKTLSDYERLTDSEQKLVREYILTFASHKVVTVNDKTYILTHSGLPPGATPDNLDSFARYDYLRVEVNLNKVLPEDTILISGHLPTFFVDEKHKGRVYRTESQIAIDTGGGLGGTFCSVCLETGEEFYIK
ncbi:MAG: metallophosphoesterase [Oscillospiraceae bacterium]|jgi:serine/threonine protein phosphatase 1|nr:metallophosphoesterase [Oscillospiraceae bacterium]